MNTTMTAVIAGLASAAALLVPAGGADARTGRIAVGEPFPDVVLPALGDGRPASIADFRGRKVLLQVFASW